MIILGIDPGTATVGWGVIDVQGSKAIPVAYGHISTSKELELPRRLSEIAADISAIIQKYHPEEAAVEELFFSNNQKTVIAVAEARGVLLLCARQAGVPVFEYTPLQVKQSVSGYGKATKKQVQEMTRTLLKLPAVPKPDDTADALAMAICHAYSYRSKQYGVALTKRQQMGYF